MTANYEQISDELISALADRLIEQLADDPDSVMPIVLPFWLTDAQHIGVELDCERLAVELQRRGWDVDMYDYPMADGVVRGIGLRKSDGDDFEGV
jgi:hypothetical protein